MTANVSTRSYTCDVCGKVNNNAGNHGRHVATHCSRAFWHWEAGYRPGSGRKPVLVGSRTRSFVLDESADARLDRFRAEQGLNGEQDASEALRRIIAIAVP